jgi:hypothetical protein
VISKGAVILKNVPESLTLVTQRADRERHRRVIAHGSGSERPYLDLHKPAFSYGAHQDMTH